jgi:type I restriction enzyme R subunit
LKPEKKAREQIDRLLEAAGWKIQDLPDLNLGASLGVAVREFPLNSGAADYLNFVDREAVGVIEAKPEDLIASFRNSYYPACSDCGHDINRHGYQTA